MPAVAGKDVKLALSDKLRPICRPPDQAVDVGQGKFFALDFPLPEMSRLVEFRCAFHAGLQFGTGCEALRCEPRRLLFWT